MEVYAIINVVQLSTQEVLNMQENCIFCKIIAGDIPSATVYEDENFKAIMDIAPAAKGHVILIPKNHCADLFSLEGEASSKALAVAAKVAKAIKEELKADGLNLLQNNGEAAGQTVFHFHIHLIPRYQGDKLYVGWEHQKYAEGEAAKIASAISARIK